MKLFSPAWRATPRAVVAWSLLIALGGCGGGVVGTGTGAGDGPGDIPGTPAGLCAAEFASASLACAAGSDDPWRGTSAVFWADIDGVDDGATVLAILEGNTMSLQVPCSQVAFLGTWFEFADGTLAFLGSFSDAEATEARAAIVRVLPAPDEPGAVGRLEMLDAKGATLYGPWLIRRVEGNVRIAECTLA
ncbi:hypothetical protein HZ992_21170 [Rhizobacter sp. AJA081-3]|uniref:hypothetical protein n=1 Tax=Rhizobacter sp. AJA081-3 TaxID=2753607 RepID=UPI001ADED5CE|nr:hypothetical protein [Rhizobacter sp. AJA081-3]QTN22622.1 hypothetical protein HZ992_21170 [Rhizobacter sp. AJA081-3]